MLTSLTEFETLTLSTQQGIHMLSHTPIYKNDDKQAVLGYELSFALRVGNVSLNVLYEEDEDGSASIVVKSAYKPLNLTVDVVFEDGQLLLVLGTPQLRPFFFKIWEKSPKSPYFRNEVAQLQKKFFFGRAC